jgi:cell wall-associated NlpC family hydrolase
LRRASSAVLLLFLSLSLSAAKKPAPVPAKAKALVRTARAYLPEETDGRRKQPKDCSDFVLKVFGAHGIKLPRTSAEMAARGKRVASTRDLRMGDLVFFSGERISRTVGHVGIYVNNGIFIHVARPEVGVRMESLYSDHYRKRYLTARRLIP